MIINNTSKNTNNLQLLIIAIIIVNYFLMITLIVKEIKCIFKPMIKIIHKKVMIKNNKICNYYRNTLKNKSNLIITNRKIMKIIWKKKGTVFKIIRHNKVNIDELKLNFFN